jgi:hypothetical protein
VGPGISGYGPREERPHPSGCGRSWLLASKPYRQTGTRRRCKERRDEVYEDAWRLRPTRWGRIRRRGNSRKTVFCKSNDTKCAVANQYRSGTAVTATLASGSRSVLNAGFAVIECGEATIGGTAEWSEANHAPHVKTTTWVFTVATRAQTVSVNNKTRTDRPPRGSRTARAGTGVVRLKMGKKR